MRIGRGVAFKLDNGNYGLGSVKEVKYDSLIAVEPNGTEHELFKGQAHRINSEPLELLIREATGVPLDVVHPSFDEPAPDMSDYDDEILDEGEDDD